MIAGSRSTGSFDWEATLRGAFWGFIIMAAAALALALLTPVYPALAQFYYLHDEPIRWVVSGLAVFLAGVIAGRRAGTLGLLHGAAAGLGSFVILAIVSLVVAGSPNVWNFASRTLLSAIVGGLGGIIGANLAE